MLRFIGTTTEYDNVILLNPAVKTADITHSWNIIFYTIQRGFILVFEGHQ